VLRPAIFFVSTGRCGTQWLASLLQESYASVAHVTHEPIKFDYHPKDFFRQYARADEVLSLPRVAGHLFNVDKTLEVKSYIEVGWPCYAAIPHLVNRYQGRIKIVHLVRHPVRTALSMATHRVYERKDLERARPDPFDPSVVLQSLQAKWSWMSPYEKCLFWWTEVNLYGRELCGRYPEVPQILVRFEDMLDPSTAQLKVLLDFLELPTQPSLEAAVNEPVDRYHNQTFKPGDWKRIFQYEQTLQLADELGYNPQIDEDAILQRYKRPLQEELRERYKKLRRELSQRKRSLLGKFGK